MPEVQIINNDQNIRRTEWDIQMVRSLVNSIDNAPPPLDEDKIKQMPTINISQDHLGKNYFK